MDILEVAEALVKEWDRSKSIESFQKVNRKGTYYRVSGTYGKGFKKLEELINDLLWDIEFLCGDDLRKGMFPKLAEVIDQAESAIQDWEVKGKDGIAQQRIVIARGYDLVWKKFTRNIKLSSDSTGVARVLNRDVNVEFNFDKSVWYEVV
ncbi:MAG: hypothetical protein ACRDBG_25890 [Waterburya sp.]